jgi:hypothetical protein
LSGRKRATAGGKDRRPKALTAGPRKRERRRVGSYRGEKTAEKRRSEDREKRYKEENGEEE